MEDANANARPDRISPGQNKRCTVVWAHAAMSSWSSPCFNTGDMKQTQQPCLHSFEEQRKGRGGGSTVNNMILAVPVRRVTYCTWCRSLNILCNKKRSKGEEKNRWMRAERGDDAITVTDADEEKSPNNTCTTTWKREADVHYVKDVVSSYCQACHHDAQVWRSIKSE